MRLNQAPHSAHESNTTSAAPAHRLSALAERDDAHASTEALPRFAVTPAPPLECSGAFLSEARRAGVSQDSLVAALETGRRQRQWDGCVVVLDWMTGVELRLDPSERFGIAVRRVA